MNEIRISENNMARRNFSFFIILLRKEIIKIFLTSDFLFLWENENFRERFINNSLLGNVCRKRDGWVF
jgi:hypothetical protein